MGPNKFSIIIPLYNKEKEIDRAINSVLRQSYEKYEVIVINDGSTDDGPEKVKNIAKNNNKIRMVSQPNAGVSAARNRGIKEAGADLIAFLDADDSWKSEFLETILRLKKKFPEAGAYATAYEEVFPSGKIVVPKFKAIPSPPWEGIIPRYFRSALGPPPVYTSAVVVPKIVLSEVGNFPVGINMAEDKDLWERIALRYPIAFSHQIVATYFQNASNRLCNIYSYVERERPFLKVAHEAIIKGELPQNKLFDLKEYIASCKLVLASIYLFHLFKPDEARRILRETFPKTFRISKRKYWLCLWTIMPTSLVRLAWTLKQNIKNLIAYL
ncbi:MAG: glycosyltransferase family 2 protein [Bacteroidales bacterium]|nr:glycosyltransferase family 2 protein [Bacteroidales bacterium]